MDNDKVIEEGSYSWTHTMVEIVDIRMFSKFYAVIFRESTGELHRVQLNKEIFDARLNSYFLGNRYTRKDLIDIRWNLYLTDGYYVKIDHTGEMHRYDGTKGKEYISFLEVSGPLGEFTNIYTQKKEV